MNDPEASAWIEAARRPALAEALAAVYGEAARAIARRGPACWASGRCCNFERYGHRLYVTGLEAASTLLFAASRPPTAHPPAPEPRGLSLPQIDAAQASGGCPFQARNLCSVHEGKPLGCRVYFCDQSSQSWQHELSEELLGQIRGLHERHGVPYRYGEWRQMLRRVTFALYSA